MDEGPVEGRPHLILCVPVCMCVCTYVHVRAHMPVCVYVCMYARVHTPVCLLVGNRKGFCCATSLSGKGIAVITVKHVVSKQQWQLCHHLDVCAMAASADALRLFCQDSACQTTQTICSHQQ